MKESKYVYLLSLVIDREVKNSGEKEFMVSPGDLAKMVRQHYINADQMLIMTPGIKITIDPSLPDDHLRVSRSAHAVR